MNQYCHNCKSVLDIDGRMIISCNCQIYQPIFLIRRNNELTYYSFYRLFYDNNIFTISSSKINKITKISSNGKMLLEIDRFYPLSLDKDIYEQLYLVIAILKKLAIFS